MFLVEGGATIFLATTLIRPTSKVILKFLSIMHRKEKRVGVIKFTKKKKIYGRVLGPFFSK
jgi:hypothetical protein